MPCGSWWPFSECSTCSTCSTGFRPCRWRCVSGACFTTSAARGLSSIYVSSNRRGIDSDTPFHYAEGDTVFAFAAVFAPTRLRKKIYHRWRVYDEAQQAWVSTDRIGYEVEGGRYRGFRGYTYKRHVRPGAWRVDVETEAGGIIGRIRFDVVPVRAPVTRLKRVVYE